jgi:hypothetical protein
MVELHAMQSPPTFAKSKAISIRSFSSRDNDSNSSCSTTDVNSIYAPKRNLQATKLSTSSHNPTARRKVQPASESNARIPTRTKLRPIMPDSGSGRSLHSNPYHSPVSVKKEDLLVRKFARSLSVGMLDCRHLLGSPPTSPEDKDLTDRDLFASVASFKSGCMEKLSTQLAATTHNPTRRSTPTPRRRSGMPPIPADNDLNDRDLLAMLKAGSLRRYKSSDDANKLNGSKKDGDFDDDFSSSSSSSGASFTYDLSFLATLS